MPEIDGAVEAELRTLCARIERDWPGALAGFDGALAALPRAEDVDYTIDVFFVDPRDEARLIRNTFPMRRALGKRLGVRLAIVCHTPQDAISHFPEQVSYLLADRERRTAHRSPKHRKGTTRHGSTDL